MKSKFPSITHPHPRVIKSVAIHFSVRLQVNVSQSLYNEIMIIVFKLKVTLLSRVIATQVMK